MFKVLIFDQDLRVANYLATVTAGLGCIPIASDSLAQTETLLESEPDIGLLILDYSVDFKDLGLRFLSELRKSLRFQSLPVIACSRDTSGQFECEIALFDVAAFLTKPLLKCRIIAEVKQVLGLE